ncbi:MAG: cupredoxin family copper-binding protein [Acidimicrobiales bacterium]
MTSTKTRRAAWLVAPVLALTVFAGCGSGDDESGSGDTTKATETTAADDPGGTTTAGGDAPAGDGAIVIKGFKFDPAEVTVKVGTKVTWTNEDSSTHTATADEGGTFDTEDLAQDDAGDFTFSEAGTFAYHCEIHKTMKGTVTVE